jgi:hypothetical protein
MYDQSFSVRSPARSSATWDAALDVLSLSTLLSRHDTISARHRFGSASLWTASWSLEMNVS